MIRKNLQLSQATKKELSNTNNRNATTLIPVTLDEMTQVTGGTPVVPDVIIRPKKTCPPST
jgi:hypothetical protein